MNQLDAELRAAIWTPRPLTAPDPPPCYRDPALSCRTPKSPFVIARDYEKQLAGRTVTLSVSYEPGEPALDAVVEALFEHVTPGT